MVEKKEKNTNESIGNKLKLVIKSGILTTGYNTNNKAIKEGKQRIAHLKRKKSSVIKKKLLFLSN